MNTILLFLAVLACCVLDVSSMTSTAAHPHPTTPAASKNAIHLEAIPQEIIPGLTPSVDIVCGPGLLASEYRQIFLIQLMTDVSSGPPVPLATLLPGQSPQLTINDPRMTVSGHLDNLSPETASLSVHVDSPLDEGRVYCKIDGLGTDGNRVLHQEMIAITTHPESNLVDVALREMVADLKSEADALLAQTKSLQQENQHLNQLTAAKQQTVAQKRADLQQLSLQLQSLQQTVADRELSLNQTAQELVQEIANVTEEAPSMRVSFNAAERTSKMYASGAQITFDTVELNEGNGYNNSISVFRPPVDGVYYLTSAQLVHDTAAASYRTYSIRINSTVVAGAYSSDDRQSSQFKHSSTSTIVHLTPYDYVRVYQQYSSSATSSLAAYSDTPNGLSTNFAGYLMC